MLATVPTGGEGASKLKRSPNEYRSGEQTHNSTKLGKFPLNIKSPMKSHTPAEAKPLPPSHLSLRTQTLWTDAVRPTDQPQRLALIQSALEALDRADEARQAIARSGLTATTRTTGAVHLHPCARVEREARAQFAQLWQVLGLHRNRDASADALAALMAKMTSSPGMPAKGRAPISSSTQNQSPKKP